jgi:CHAT domain-containing protein/Tfp pilus assembly protein PilF
MRSRLVFWRYFLLMAAVTFVSYAGSQSVASRTTKFLSSLNQHSNDQLLVGKTLEKTISGGQVHSYVIQGEKDQYLHLTVAQQGIDVVLAFFEPDGTKLGEVDQTEFGPEAIIGVMGPAGPYRLELRPVVENASAGKYQITIEELRPVREEDRAQIKARAEATAAVAEGGELLDKGDETSLKAAVEKYQRALSLWRQVKDKYWEAFTLTYELGVTYRLLYQKQPAIEAHNQALQIFRSLKDRSGEAGALGNIGSVYGSLWESVGEKRKALEYYNQALTILKEIGDHHNEGVLLTNTGVLCESIGEYQKALAYYNQALSVQSALGDSNGEAITLLNIGAVYSSLGDNPRALDYLNRALPLLRAAGNRHAEASVLRNLGTVYSELGDVQKAIELHKQALAIFQALPDRSGAAEALTGLGSAYESLSDAPEALNYYKQALPLRKAIGDRRQEAVLLLRIGQVTSDLFGQQSALEYYTQALTLFTAIADPDNAETTALIGTIYGSLGEQQKALEYYIRALPIIRAGSGPIKEAQTLEKIGTAYRELGQWEQALTSFNQALGIFHASGSRSAEADVLNGIGLVYDNLAELQKARDSYERALALFKEVRDRRGEAVTLNNLGSVYNSLNEDKQALDYYLQAWRLHQALGDRPAEATILNNIGLIYSEFDHNKEALEFFNLALSIERSLGDPSGEAITLDNLGSLYHSLKEPQKAIESYYQALALHRSLGERLGEAVTLSNLSGIWWERNAGLAIFYSKQSVNVYQQIRGSNTGLDKDWQKSFLRSVDDNHRLLSDLLIAQDRLQEAHQVLNLFKDQEFFDFNREIKKEASLLTLTPREMALTKRYEEIAARLQIAYEQLSEAKLKIGGRQPSTEEAAQLQQVEAQFKSTSNEFRNFGQEAEGEFKQPLSARDKVGKIADTLELQTALRELKRQTGQNAVAVYTLAGPKNFRSLIISSDRINAVSQAAKRDDVETKALQLWGLLQSDQYDPRPLSAELYSVVFKPMEVQLPKDTTTILWSLDGNLRYVPMGALYDGKQYLVERYNHAVFTRADRERLTRAVSPHWIGLGLGSSEAHTVEVLGDKISFEALPGVTEELRQLFRQKNSTQGVLDGDVLPDAKFTKAAMLAALKQKRPLVHISSHFSFRPGDEARSFLLLGDGSAMTLEEMKQHLGLFNGVELLTLSACNTAAQQAGNGREIDGFAELAQRLGAASVMATLWPVADNSTPWFMRDFYQSREKGEHLSKAEAIRRAQLALLNGTAETKPLPARQKGGPSPIRIVIGEGGGKRAGNGTRSDVVYVDAADAPPFKRDEAKPFAHPYYWAPFILIGNWK